MKKTALFLACCVVALISPWAGAQNTQITASHIAYFGAGGTLITGTMCLTPTNQAGQPINIVTSVGQQISPQVPLCFPITSGVLSSLAIVPDTSLTQPVNACYNAVINNYYGTQVAVFPCIQPSGSTWSFDAFVPSSMPSIPALQLPQFRHNGILNTSQNGLNIVGSGVTESPAGTINIPSGVLPAASGYGLVPVYTGPGTATSPQQAVLSFGSSFDQYSQQQVNNANYTTFRVNDLNNVFYADGFTAAGQYTGIGVAQVAYGGSTEYPLCQAVSYSGSNYVAVGHSNIGITPGTNLAIWSVPVPNSGPTTGPDCAFYTAYAYSYSRSVQTSLVFGGQFYNTQGMIEPTGLYSVNLIGQGIFGSFLTYTGTAATPVIYRPDGGNNYTYLQIKNFIIDGGGVASSIMDLGQLNQSVAEEIQGQNIAPSALGSGGHFFEFGLSPGDSFQMMAKHITTSVPGNRGNSAQIIANLTGSTLSSFTVTNGGSAYPPPSSTAVYTVQVRGYQGGTAVHPCTVMPTWTGVPVTIAAGVLTAIAAPTSGGTGCVGPLYVQVYESFPVDYSVIWNSSDSTMIDSTFYAGNLAAVEVLAGDNVFVHLHPSIVPNGVIVNGGSAIFDATELDGIFDKGFQLFEPYPTQATSINGTHGYDAGYRLAGSVTYYLGSSGTNATFGPSASLCDASATIPPLGWQEFVTQSGPIQTQADYLTKAPADFSVTGNDTTCGEVIGDYQPTATFGKIISPSIVLSGITPGTTPVCPNGTGGALTTAGCTSAGAGLGANSFTGSQTIASGSDLILNGGVNLHLYSDTSATYAGWDFFDGTNQFFKVLDTTSGGATGATMASGGCMQWTSSSSGLSLSDSFICRPNAHNFTFGSVPGDSIGVVMAGMYVVGGYTFTATGCSNSTLVGGATAGSFHSGTTGTCTVTITMANSDTAPNGFSCNRPNDLTTNSDSASWSQTATTSTTATLSGTTVSGDVINFACTPY